MRHQAKYVPVLVDHPGDVADAAIRVLTRRVAEGDPPGGLEGVELIVRGEVAAAHVLDRDREAVSAVDRRSEGALEVLGDQLDLPAEEAETFVGKEGAGQQPSLAKHLEAIADPEH